MKRMRANPVARVGAFLLSMAVLAGAFWSAVVTVGKWDDLWLAGDYHRSSSAYEDTLEDVARVRELMTLYMVEEYDGALSYLDGERMRFLEQSLDSAVTNFRYQVHDQSGSLLSSNMGGASLQGSTGRQWTNAFNLYLHAGLSDGDYRYVTGDGVEMMMVTTENGAIPCDPRDSEGGVNQYGWYSDGERFVEYISERDSRVRVRELVLEYGLAQPFAVEDDYVSRAQEYQQLQRWLPRVAALALALCLAALGGMIFLWRSAGRREDGSVVPGWQERVPYDLYLLLDGLLFAVLFSAGEQIAYAFDQNGFRPAVLVGLGVFALAGAALVLGLLMTTSVRVKRRALLRTTLIFACLRRVRRFCRRAAENWPITRRAVWVFLLYLAGTVLTGVTVILIPVYQGFALWCVCRWVRQWQAIREGTAQIVGGDPEHRIDAGDFYRDLREHAAQLNDLGSAISTAVDERMRSERMKAELITNVSHDLKTPLTSIINYVDLLKKAGIQDPTALEYLEVLERKSQRLKKLTEDLVEASKASTGNLTVSRERLGMVQLVCQALGEYEEKFAGKALEVVAHLPEEECWVLADGRHLWRVIDNLFSNCYKYAMPHTRVYLDMTRWDGSVVLSVKNISQQPLNIPAEQLLERFVRGEESRSTEGSGLGLSIARSLTELQGGAFRLAIDGDLFKAVVTFPEYTQPLPLPAGETDGPDDMP